MISFKEQREKKLEEQEIPLDDSHFRFMFAKNLVTTRGALRTFGAEVVFACLLRIQKLAERHQGLDHLQIFRNLSKIEFNGKDLYFIEDGQTVTALLPEDY